MVGMFAIDYGVSAIRVVCMKQWSLNLRGPKGNPQPVRGVGESESVCPLRVLSMGMEMFCVMRVSVGLIRTHIWWEPPPWIF